jgi:hypothetical protein
VKQPISPRIHGLIDYLSVPLLIAAGPLFHFAGHAAEITSTVAGVVLIYSAFTKYPPGVVKLIPLRVHRAIDVALALMFIIYPHIPHLHASWDPSARIFFVGYGFLVLVVTALTDWTGQAA